MADQTASYVLLQNALHDHGFSSRTYLVGEHEFAEYTHPNGAIWLTRTEHFSYPLNHGAVMEMADQKALAEEWVRQFGASTPDTIVLLQNEKLNKGDAQAFLDKYQKLVVKPETSFGSKGLTMNITNLDDLAQALEKARAVDQLRDSVLVQQQVPGEEFRFAILGGKVQGVIAREKLRIIGDGVSTIGELIAIENTEREKVSEHTLVKYPAVEEVAQFSYDEAEVLPAGEKRILSEATLIAGGASVYDVSDKVHESYVQFTENLATKMGAGFIVVDLLLQDISVPMTAANTYFNEFNKAPALKMFYSERNGSNVDILPELARAIAVKMETI